MITALATGVAALLFFSLKYLKYFLAKYNALAGGLMLSASLNLIFEGFKIGKWRNIAGMAGFQVLIAY